MQITATIIPLALVLLQACGVSAAAVGTGFAFYGAVAAGGAPPGRPVQPGAKNEFQPNGGAQSAAYECEICVGYRPYAEPILGCETGKPTDVVTIEDKKAEDYDRVFRVRILKDCKWKVIEPRSMPYNYYIQAQKQGLTPKVATNIH
ncbi:hypothetical protein ACKVWC_005781 [Pyricularia oryzae]